MLLQPIFVIGSSYNFALYCLPVHRPIFTREKHHGNRVYLFLSLLDSCCSTKTQICSGSALGTKDEILKTDSSSTIELELANYTTSLTTHEALQKPTQIPSLSSQLYQNSQEKGGSSSTSHKVPQDGSGDLKLSSSPDRRQDPWMIFEMHGHVNSWHGRILAVFHSSLVEWSASLVRECQSTRVGQQLNMLGIGRMAFVTMLHHSRLLRVVISPGIRWIFFRWVHTLA